MILDNLFAMVGGTGTASILLGLVAFFGFVPATTILCSPNCPVIRGRLSRSL